MIMSLVGACCGAGFQLNLTAL